MLGASLNEKSVGMIQKDYTISIAVWLNRGTGQRLSEASHLVSHHLEGADPGGLSLMQCSLLEKVYFWHSLPDIQSLCISSTYYSICTGVMWDSFISGHDM
ncbi:hypothetical protein NDU88_003047 [Pleurodeles waltl]|uniref:Uncharacterized protein n=1 Tax=Pleurodeles waltl TaxID=8319 RepID=A0AAV7W469_PLEWA|nr:hypothetical protein NDU88_003047 [Pleurodeles waltl]